MNKSAYSAYDYDDEGDMPPESSENWADQLLEDDEIDAGEAGFIIGYKLAEEESFD